MCQYNASVKMQTEAKCSLPDFLLQRMNYIVAGMAGLLFFLGWWFIIDANMQYEDEFYANKPYHLPGVTGTIALFCVNILPQELLYNSYYYSESNCCTPCVAKTFLFMAFMASFGSLIGASFILINDFMLNLSKYQWPGYAIWIQTVLIFMSSLLLRFGRRQSVI